MITAPPTGSSVFHAIKKDDHKVGAMTNLETMAAAVAAAADNDGISVDP